MVSNWTCRHSFPFFGCGSIENLILGLFFFSGMVLSIVLLIYLIKSQSKTSDISKLDYICVVSLVIWMLYRSIISFFPFNFSPETWFIFTDNTPVMLFLCSIQSFTLRMCELLFSYESPAARIIIFFRTFFITLTCCFVVIGLALSIANSKTTYELGECISFWEFGLILLTIVFYVIPALRLVKAILHSATSNSNQQFAFNLTILSFIFIILLASRGIFNLFAFFHINALETYINDSIEKSTYMPPHKVRWLVVLYYFFLDFCPAMIILLIKFIIQKHDNAIFKDPHFTTQESDIGIFDDQNFGNPKVFEFDKFSSSTDTRTALASSLILK